MGIRSKPRQEFPPLVASDERAVETFIGKGGAVASAPAADEANIQRLQLRIPKSLVRRIDAVRPKGLTAPSRHDWFLQAMIEKLERDEAGTEV